MRATGTVTAFNQQITASDDSGGSEMLTGLIQTNANVQPGDSGGPLLDPAERVVGIDTAASSSGSYGYQDISRTSEGYAVPIATALSVVRQIESGDSSGTVHVGGTAFLGVNLTIDQWAPGRCLHRGRRLRRAGGHAGPADRRRRSRRSTARP